MDMTLPRTPASPVDVEDGVSLAGMNGLECPLCQLGLSNSDDLQQHVLTHAGERKAYECKVCSKVCPDIIIFSKHVRLHSGEKPFQCKHCGKCFGEKCSLTRHARTHTGEKPFECKVCGKCFSDVGSFGRHNKTHMGQEAKVHCCPFDNCERSFIDRSSLKRHEKTHTGEKPFLCKICSRRFTESGSFKRHLRVHTGEKRYKCRVCSRAFSERASMVRHERNVCLLDRNRDWDPDSSSAYKGNLSPYSLTDFYHSLIGKHSDALNNNNNNSIYSSFETDGSNDAMENNGWVAGNGCDDDDRMKHGGSGVDRMGQGGNASEAAATKRDSWDYSSSNNSVYKTDSCEGSDRRALKKDGATRSYDLDSNTGIRVTMPNDGGHGSDATALEAGGGDKGSLLAQSKKQQSSRNALLRESSDVSLDMSYRWSPQDQTAKDDIVPDKICSVPTRMFHWHHRLEPRVYSSRKAGKEEEEVQMCFECGDVLEENEEDRSTNDSASTSSDGRRSSLRCKACRLETCALPPSDRSSPLVTEDIHLPRKKDGGAGHCCSYCQKVFKDSSKLKRHIKIHLGVRDFKCEFCGKGFIDACGLRRHISVHSDVKPHNCVQCGKGFTDSSGLKKHLVKCNPQALQPTKGTPREHTKHSESKVSKDNRLSPSIEVKEETAEVKQVEDAISAYAKLIQQLRGNGVTFDNKFLSHISALVKNEGPHVKASLLTPWATFAYSAKLDACDKPQHEIKAESMLQDCSSAIDLSRTGSAHVLHKQRRKSHRDEHSLHQLLTEHVVVDSSKGGLLAAVTSPQGMKKTFQDDLQRRSTHCRGLTGTEGTHSLRADGTGGSRAEGTDSLRDEGIDGSSCREDEGGGREKLTEEDSSVHPPVPGSACHLSFTSRDCSFPSFPASSTDNHHQLVDHSGAEGALPQLSPLSSFLEGNSPKCEVCGKTFDDLSSLKRHARLHWEQPQQLPCFNCDKVFSDPGSLKRHSLRGCKAVIAAVIKKEKTTVDKKSAAAEISFSSSEQFSCTQCQMVFETRDQQMTHEKEHRVAPELCCAVCRKSFPSDAALRSHQLLHEAERPFSCEVCLKGFAESGSLTKHRSRGCYAHCSVLLDASKLRCSYCGKVFSDQANFDHHISSHRSVKPHVCAHCGKSFTEACSLKRHTRQHTGQNLCRCLHCGRTFLENSGLKKHLQRRSCMQEKKPVKSWLYPCSACDKVFTKRYILGRHMKTHTGLRPFVCDVCDKSFTESSSLKRHYRQHTGERPYQCHGCHKSFTDSGVLKKHKQRCTYVADDDDHNPSLLHRGAPYLLDGSAFALCPVLPLQSKPPQSFHNGQSDSLDCAQNGKSCSRRLAKSFKTGQCAVRESSKKPPFSSRLLPSTQCWRCSRHFATADKRERHTVVAHGNKPWLFECRLCWRRFTRLPYLRVHRKARHSLPN